MVGRDARRGDAAVITTPAGKSWYLGVGDMLTFGRSRDCDISFGASGTQDAYVDDREISRLAGLLEGRAGLVLVHNRSTSKPLSISPRPGSGGMILPGAIVALPQQYQVLALHGSDSRYYEISINLAGLIGAPTGGDGGFSPIKPVSKSSPQPSTITKVRVSNSELRLLAALCEPVLLETFAIVSTRNKIADRLQLEVNIVNDRLRRLRTRLTERHGMSWLKNDEEGIVENFNFLPSLANWALLSGTVSRDTLKILDSASGDSR